MQLKSSDGQLFELSAAAARQSITLQGAKVVGDDAVPVLLDSGRLRRITSLLEQTAAAFGLEAMTDERGDALLKHKDSLPRGDMGAQLRAATAAVLEGVDGVADFATLLLDLKWFDAPLLTSILAEGVARLLKKKSADTLRTLLEASDDLGDQEKEAALREPLFAPPAAVPAAAAPPPLTGVLLAMDGEAPDEGNATACLKRCDAQTLRRLKAVSAGLQQRARRALWDRLLEMCPQRTDRDRPQCLDDVEELDVEEFPGEVVAAVRSMPNLARIRGYGFRVELKGPQGVEQAALDGTYRAGLLQLDLGAALRRCIHEGKGEPPHELLLAAAACGARGKVLGVPVQRLREDAVGRTLDLSHKGLGVIGAELLALVLPAAISLRELRLGNNQLCGLDYWGEGTYTTEGITKLCDGLKGSSVTSLDLRVNVLGPEGGAALAEGLRGNSTLQSLNIGYNEIGDKGASALAAVLKETMISNLDIEYNKIGDRGASALAAILKETMISNLNVDGHPLQIDELKGTKPTEKIDLSRKGLGVASAIIIASCIKGNGVLKTLDLAGDQLCGLDWRGRGTFTTEGITKLCEALKGSAVTSLALRDNQLCGVSRRGYGTYITEGITKLCEGLKGSAVTSLDLAENALCGLYDDEHGDATGTYTTEGITKLCEALKGSAVTSLNLFGNRIGAQGASVLAAVLKETQIAELDLRGNDIGVKGASTLAAILEETQIQQLDLLNNSLGDGAIAITSVACEMPQIITLCGIQPEQVDIDFSNRGFDAADAKLLAFDSSRNQSVRTINLWGNNLGPEGGAALAEGLRGNSTLQSLNLLNNSLGDGVDAILSAAAGMPQIITLCGIQPEQTDINFSHRSLDAADAKLLAFDLSRNQSVRTVNLWGNSLTNKAKQVLKDAAGSSVHIRF